MTVLCAIMLLIAFYLQNKSELNSGRSSPTLDDLEEKKRLLLSALESDVTLLNSPNVSIAGNISEKEVEISDDTQSDVVSQDTKVDSDMEVVTDSEVKDETVETLDDVVMSDDTNTKAVESDDPTPVDKDDPNASNRDVESSSRRNSEANGDRTPTTEAKRIVKTTLYGTPVMNITSPYVKLPSDDKFSKDICDVINFENLPNSTGKYKKICSLLKKVKSEVDRIQDS